MLYEYKQLDWGEASLKKFVCISLSYLGFIGENYIRSADGFYDRGKNHWFFLIKKLIFLNLIIRKM